MPKQTKTRGPGWEANVAARLRAERLRSGMSYETLAEAMGAVGCHTHPSALHKVEKADPPRRITVNELVAYSTVFDVSLNDFVKVDFDDEDDHKIFQQLLKEMTAALEDYRLTKQRLYGAAQVFADRFPVLPFLERLVVENELGTDFTLVDESGAVTQLRELRKDGSEHSEAAQR